MTERIRTNYKKATTLNNPVLSLPDLAELVNVSGGHIARTLKKHGGIEPTSTFRKGRNTVRLFDRAELIQWAEAMGWAVK